MGGSGSTGVVMSVSPSSGVCGAVVASAPAVRTASRQVWVPNVVTEEVPEVTSTSVTEEVAYTVYEQKSEQIPYECTYLVNRAEQRTGTRKVVEYVTETRERTRKQVNYVDETRTRTRRELSYRSETKTETYPVVTYRTDKRTKEVSYTYQIPEQVVEPYSSTRYDQVAEQVVEEYSVQVQVPTMREVQIQVCRMVPKLVPYTYNPCAEAAVSSGTMSISSGASAGGCGAVGGGCGSAVSGGCGCGAAAPVATGCGCR
jgi:hypothetical protein